MQDHRIEEQLRLAAASGTTTSIPSSSRKTKSRATARQLLEISKEEICSLQAAVPVLSHLHSTEMLPDVQREPPVFQCVSMGYCPGTVYH